MFFYAEGEISCPMADSIVMANLKDIHTYADIHIYGERDTCFVRNTPECQDLPSVSDLASYHMQYFHRRDERLFLFVNTAKALLSFLSLEDMLGEESSFQGYKETCRQTRSTARLNKSSSL